MNARNVEAAEATHGGLGSQRHARLRSRSSASACWSQPPPYEME